MALSN